MVPSGCVWSAGTWLPASIMVSLLVKLAKLSLRGPYKVTKEVNISTVPF